MRSLGTASVGSAAGASVGIVLVGMLMSHAPAAGQSLRGSPTSLDRQNRVARAHDFSYLRSSDQVRRFVESGYLVRVLPDANVELKAVSFPYARPEVKLFVQRLGAQYRAACGERLVVTSLTRPTSRQPRNASPLSVHPTGMALDLRRSNDRGCRSWLEDVLLSLEERRVLEATRERRPPHYHVAIFPKQYSAYVDALLSGRLAAESNERHRVRSGDSLWSIARRYGTTIDRLQAENRLRSSRIYEGQILKIPVAPNP